MTNGECGRADFSTYCSSGSQHSTSCSPHWPASPLIQEINWTRMLCSKLIHPDVHFWSFPASDVVWPVGQNMLPSGAEGTDISLFSLGYWPVRRWTKWVYWRTNKVCPWNVADLWRCKWTFNGLRSTEIFFCCGGQWLIGGYLSTVYKCI